MGLAQFATDEDKAVNIARALEHISNAAQLGADIIVLPVYIEVSCQNLTMSE